MNLAFAFASRLRVDKAVRFTGSNLIRGMQSCNTRNNRTFVMAKVLALLKNSVIGKRSTQSFWKWFT